MRRKKNGACQPDFKHFILIFFLILFHSQSYVEWEISLIKKTARGRTRLNFLIKIELKKTKQKQMIEIDWGIQKKRAWQELLIFKSIYLLII